MEWQTGTFSSIDWNYGAGGNSNTSNKYKFFKELLTFVISGVRAVAEHFGRGLHRTVYKFKSGQSFVVAKLQKADRHENQNELAAFTTMMNLRPEHVPMFNKKMFTLNFSGHSLCALLVEFVPFTGEDFVRALLQESSTFDNRQRLAHFMVQLVELINEFHNCYGFLIKDVSLCNVGLRSLEERTVLLIDLDRFEKAGAETDVRTLKRMYTVPGEVAQIALDFQACDETWRNINWFGLKNFFANITEFDAVMFRSYCDSLFSVTEVPEVLL